MILIGLHNSLARGFKRIFGPELCTDPTLDNPGEWGLSGESTVSGGVGRIYSSAGSYSGINNPDIITSGLSYRLQYEVIATNGVDLANATSSFTFPASTTGVKVVTYTADSNHLFFKRKAGITDVTIDNVSIKKIL